MTTTPRRAGGGPALLYVLGLTLAGCAHATRTAPPALPDLHGAGPPISDSVPVGYGGLGAQPRRDVTGAVGSVVVARDGRARVGRVEELLVGRVPGVDVRRLEGGELRVRVRGAVTGPGGGEPLYVVDGMPLPNGAALSGLNPDDVARIDVLKDWSTAAAYGSRAANGVIVITTRRGRRD